MHTKKKPYNGVWQIVFFNWPFYVVGLFFVFVSIYLFCSFALPWFIQALLLLGAGLSLFWIFSSLIASYWIYDRAFAGSWEWVKASMNSTPRSIAQFHAGFDETGGELQSLFPNTPWTLANIHPQTEAITASLERARQNQTQEVLQVNPTSMPYEAESFSGIFLIFSAHELRNPQTRLQFFSELQRVLETGGHILMVEHLRDFSNFAAFGPNFVHFYSRREWLNCIQSSSLKIVGEFSKTPFVRVFILEK